MVFHWNMSDNFPLVSWTLPSILVDLNKTIVWIVTTHPIISKTSSPFNNPLVTVQRAPITIGIIVSFMFYSFSNSLTMVEKLILCFRSLSVLLCGQQSPQLGKFFFFSFFFFFFFDYHLVWWRCPWCNGYRRRKWT